MKFVVTMQHPAHVHFFRNAIDELEAAGHQVSVFLRDVEMAGTLLEQYDIDHEVLAPASDSLLSLATSQLQYELRLFQRVRQVAPDVLLAIGEPGITHVSTLLDCQSVLFTDTEHATLQNRLSVPFADWICTPACYGLDYGENHIRYPGYHELAYLHPDRFTPDPTIVDEIGADHDERLVLLRLVAWNALHDIGGSGFADTRRVIERLEQHGARVLITSEADLPAALEQYQVSVRPHRIHHLLYYADLFIGEGATMAAEAAVLGTPAVFASSLELSDEAEHRARKLLQNAKEQGVHSGKSPVGLAAAAVYAAALLTNEKTTQAAVSEVADISEVTIRNRYHELLEAEQGLPMA